jgi:WD40 repeat protein
VSVDEDLIQSLDDDYKKEETAEPTAFENINRFSVETLKSSPEPLSCKSLIAHTKAVFDVAFSDDGSFLVSGGKDERLLLWPINSENPQPNEMESTHKQLIHCLAVSPDTKRIFSGGVSRNVVVYDSQT